MISLRRITNEDYPDICDISKDIWDGGDYLPTVFHKWTEDEGYFMAAVDDEKNKVIGVGKYSILNDKSGWLEGLRVHKDYRGLKIARKISEELLIIAKNEFNKGNIKRIGLGTHISNTESISLIEKLGFKPTQKYIIIEGPEGKKSNMHFEIHPWDLSFEDFKSLDYFKVRNNTVPLAFVFEEPSLGLYEDLKKSNSFICVNGFNGILKTKGETHFISIDDNFTAIDVFMNYAMTVRGDKNPIPTFTSVLPESDALIGKLREKGYISWSDWEPDYLYYIYE